MAIIPITVHGIILITAGVTALTGMAITTDSMTAITMGTITAITVMLTIPTTSRYITDLAGPLKQTGSPLQIA